MACDWTAAQAFVATVNGGSFSAAARALGITQPTVGRQVARLEEELGVTLFERIGNQLRLTEAGRGVFEHASRMEEAALEVELTARGQAVSLEGEVAITASEAIAAHLLAPALARLRQDYPRLFIEIVASNEARDLRRREADIAVRNYQPREPELIGKKVATEHASLYVAPTFLKEHGPIETFADVERLQLFAFDHTDIMIEGLQAQGLEVTRENFPITTGNHLVQWELCKRGVGVCIMMDRVGASEAGVEKILPEISIPVPVWLVAHREVQTSRRIRVVFDLLAEVLSSPQTPPA